MARSLVPTLRPKTLRPSYVPIETTRGKPSYILEVPTLRPASGGDPLTGLPDRGMLDQHLRIALARAVRGGERLALMIVDLDDTRRINDALGFAITDRYIRAVGARLSSRTREGDVLARLDGDSFALLAFDVGSYNNAFAVARRLLSALSEPIEVDRHEIFASACIGVAVVPDDSADRDELLRHADAALRHAKADGRGRVATFQAEMVAGALERLDLEADLRHALTRGEFILHYQPQIDLATGHVTGLEALARWNHPTRGPVSPAAFIPVVEDSGFVDEFGAWVLRAACGDVAASANEHCQIAVNVSPPQFSSASFTDVVRDTLRTSGLPPWRLELEITENVLLRDIGLVGQRLAELCSLGVKVAIDDFGTGYSSIAYLRQLPVHRLKIDRSFVSGIGLGGPRQDTADLVRAMVDLGHSLGMEVVGEGIELPDQYDHLRSIGCDFAQGYLFGRPTPLALVDFSPRADERSERPLSSDATARPTRKPRARVPRPRPKL